MGKKGVRLEWWMTRCKIQQPSYLLSRLIIIITIFSFSSYSLVMVVVDSYGYTEPMNTSEFCKTQLEFCSVT